MPRSIWNGSISFGLVNVPVQLFSAVESQGRALPRVPSRHRRAHQAQARVRADRARRSSTPTSRRATRPRRGKYVMVTQEELESVEPGQSRTIDIEDFVELAEIDPIYFDKPYYVAPQKGAEKSYALLREAMAKSGRVAIAPVRHAHQAVPRRDPRRPTTCWSSRRCTSPTRSATPTTSTSRSAPRCRTASCRIANQLIDSLTTEWKPSALRGHVPRTRARPRPPQGQGADDRRRGARRRSAAKVVDLVEALQRSLDAQPAEAQAHGRATKKTAKRTAKKPAKRTRRARADCRRNRTCSKIAAMAPPLPVPDPVRLVPGRVPRRPRARRGHRRCVLGPRARAVARRGRRRSTSRTRTARTSARTSRTAAPSTATSCSARSTAGSSTATGACTNIPYSQRTQPQGEAAHVPDDRAQRLRARVVPPARRTAAVGDPGDRRDRRSRRGATSTRRRT